MDYLARRRQEMLEAMESCRTGSDDLSDRAFAELADALADDGELRVHFQRVQETDAAIKAAFADVPVPPGLAERLSHRLAESTPADPIAIQVVAGPESPTPLRPDSAVRRSKQFSGRRLAIASAAASLAAIVLAPILVAVWMHAHRAPSITAGRAIDEAVDFFNRDNGPLGPLVSQVAPPADFPMSTGIAPLPQVRWRRVEKFLGGPAVAYDLPAMGGRATLYVVNRTVADLPSSPPQSPTLTTGGNSAAAWQSGNLLYVLVVQGDARTYADYLDQSPLT